MFRQKGEPNQDQELKMENGEKKDRMPKNHILIQNQNKIYKSMSKVSKK